MQTFFPSEKQTHKDPQTGAEVIQWTASPVRDNHLYFTTPSVTADDRWLVFMSDRVGAVNLFAADRLDGSIYRVSDNIYGTQRSYCWPVGDLHGLVKSSPFLDPVRNRLYYVLGDALWFVDLNTLTSDAPVQPHRVWTTPAGWWSAFNHISPDGRTACVPVVHPRAFPDGLHNQKQQMDIGPRIIDALGLHSHIYMVDVESGQAEIAAEVPFWVTHVQFDPTGSGRVIFNQEGHRVHHHSRTWCLEPDGSYRPLYEEPENEFDNHENWSSDGSMIVYHGMRNGEPLIAARRWDGSLVFEWLMPDEPIGHTTPTLDSSGFVTDGGGQIAIYKQTAGGAPKRFVLCGHNARSGPTLNQDDHVHPLITPKGDRVIYSSNVLGVSNVYEVSASTIEEFPVGKL